MQARIEYSGRNGVIDCAEFDNVTEDEFMEKVQIALACRVPDMICITFQVAFPDPLYDKGECIVIADFRNSVGGNTYTQCFGPYAGCKLAEAKLAELEKRDDFAGCADINLLIKE